MPKTTLLTPENAANIANHQSGHKSWGPLTITWFLRSDLPEVMLVVTLEGKIIGIGGLNPKSDVTPASFDFKGAVGNGPGEVYAKGTLLLNLRKKEVAFKVTVYHLVFQEYKGTLFNY